MTLQLTREEKKYGNSIKETLKRKKIQSRKPLLPAVVVMTAVGNIAPFSLSRGISCREIVLFYFVLSFITWMKENV